MDAEKAKATQEVAKTVSKGLETVDKLGQFLNEVVGDGLKDIGGIFSDWAKYFREKNLLFIHDKVEAIHQQRKIQGKITPIASRYAIPLIQNASQEDDDLLQTMWAGLIANSTDPGKSVEPKKIYIEILSSLEPLDAKLLRFFNDMDWNMMPISYGGGYNVQRLVTALSEDERTIQLSLQNLARLGCVMDSYQSTWDGEESTSIGARISDPATTFRPTPLGFDLLKICDTN